MNEGVGWRAPLLSGAAGAVTALAIGVAIEALPGAPDAGIATIAAAWVITAGVCTWPSMLPFVFGIGWIASGPAMLYLFVTPFPEDGVLLLYFLFWVTASAAFTLTAGLGAVLVRRFVGGSTAAAELVVIGVVGLLGVRVPAAIALRAETRDAHEKMQTIRREELAYAASHNGVLACSPVELSRLTGMKWLWFGSAGNTLLESHLPGYAVYVSCGAQPQWLEIVAESVRPRGPQLRLRATGG